MNNLSERYKRHSNKELFEILANADNYMPDAVVVAKLEYESRSISENEEAIFKLEWDKKKQKEVDLKNKHTEKQQKLKTDLTSMSPLENGKITNEKGINILVVFFAFLFIYNVIKGFALFAGLFTTGISTWDLSTFQFIIPFLLLPLAVFNLWLRKKIGWILLTIYLIYNVLNYIVGVLFYLYFMYLSKSVEYDFLPVAISFKYLIRNFVVIVFNLLVLRFLYKKNIQKIYMIKRNDKQISIGISIALFFITLLQIII